MSELPEIELINSVRSDLESFIKHYLNSHSVVNFESFSEFWRERCLSAMLVGHYSWTDILEFLHVLFLQLSHLYIESDCSNRKITVIFLMYGFWFKLPDEMRTHVWIRITQNIWDDMFALCRNLNTTRHSDLRYTFFHLVYSGAFTYVAELRQMAPDLHYRVNCGLVHEQKTDTLAECLQPEFSHLSVLHEKYMAVKTVLQQNGQIEKLDSVCEGALDILNADLSATSYTSTIDR